MNDENERHFLLAITVVFALSLAMVAIFCGEDVMKSFKIIFFIGFCIFSILICIFFGFLLFSKKNISNVEKTKSWSVYKSETNLVDVERLLFNKDSVEIQKQEFLKNLRIVDFDAVSQKVSANTFSHCINIEEVNFYKNPGKDFDKDAFNGCTLLKTVNLVGNYEDWKDFQITVPVDCEIKFLPTKNIVIPEILLKKVKNNDSIIMQNYIYNTLSDTTENKPNSESSFEVNADVKIDNSESSNTTISIEPSLSLPISSDDDFHSEDNEPPESANEK